MNIRSLTQADRARALLLRQGERGLDRFRDLVHARMAPAQVWVFGSRARGDERADSDWDLLVVFDDADAVIAEDVRTLWRLSREAGLVGDVVAITATDAYAARNVANTLMYEVSREAIRIA
jgi:predicted nucleotidyltransferase